MPVCLQATRLWVYTIAGLLMIVLMSPAPHVALAAPATYYVAPNGRDTNPGTQNAPFQSIKKANSVVKAGDTVFFRSGTYMLTSSGWIGAKGTAAARITFQSYPGELAVFDGSQLNAQDDVIAIGGSYIDFKDTEIRNSQGVGIGVWGGSHIRILNNVIHGSQRQAIWCGYTDFTTVNDIVIDGNTIYDNVLSNRPVTPSSPHPSAVLSHRASNITFTNNLVYQNYGEGINPALTKGGLIAWNTLHDNYVNNIYLDNTTDFRVEGNFVYTTNDQRFYNSGAPASGIMIANETYNLTNPSANLVVINNILSGARFNFGYGDYDRGGGLQNLVFANNTLVNATQAALHMDGNPNHANLVFANNIVTQSGNSGKMLDSWNGTAGYANMTFHHNLWFGGTSSSIAGAGDTNSDPLFVNPGGTQPTDYQLQSGSPAVNTGVALTTVKDDFWGACRPSGAAYDLGAHEASVDDAQHLNSVQQLSGAAVFLPFTQAMPVHNSTRC